MDTLLSEVVALTAVETEAAAIAATAIAAAVVAKELEQSRRQSHILTPEELVLAANITRRVSIELVEDILQNSVFPPETIEEKEDRLHQEAVLAEIEELKRVEDERATKTEYDGEKDGLNDVEMDAMAVLELENIEKIKHEQLLIEEYNEKQRRRGSDDSTIEEIAAVEAALLAEIERQAAKAAEDLDTSLMASVMFLLAQVHLRLAKFIDAEKMLLSTEKLRIELYTLCSVEVMEVREVMALCMRRQAKYDDAATLYNEVRMIAIL